MREIKFRAWHEGRMVYWRLFRSDDTYLLDEATTIDEDTDPIMQYIGLKDKNCKEIYEGDIIQYLYSRKLIKGEIAWGCFGFWIKGHGERELFYIEAHQVEVIGNIYENPELLE